MDTSQYYNLTFSEVRGGLIVYQDDFKGFNKDLLTAGMPVDNWPSDVTLYVKGKRPTDYLFYPLAPWITISKKAQLALVEANINGIQYLPVQISHKSGIEIHGYAIVNVLAIVAALDYEHTTWMTPDRERVAYPQLNILEEALLKKAVTGHEIFRLDEQKTQIYVSRFLKECLEQKKATVGFGFLSVPVYE